MSSKAVRESRAKSAEVAAIPSEDAVLARVREVRKTQRDAELELFLLALETARRSPVTEECSIIDCRTSRDLPVSYCDRATNWFAAVAGFSEEGAFCLLIQALEISQRLPQLYERVLDGRTRPYMARMVADETLHLSDEAALFVDAQVAAAGAVRGRWAIQGLVRQAMIAHMPGEYAALLEAEKGPTRRAEVSIGPNGLGGVDATISAFTAADLDQTLAYGAEQLKAAGSVEDLDARRSYALEDVIAAAHEPESGEQGAFDLTGGHGDTNNPTADEPDTAVGSAGGGAVDGAGGPDRTGAGPAADQQYEGTRTGVASTGDGLGEESRPRWSGRGVPRGKVLMYIHLNASAFWPDGRPPVGAPSDSDGQAGGLRTGARRAGSIDPDYVAGRLHREPARIEGPGLPGGFVLTAAEVAAMFNRPTCRQGDEQSQVRPRISVRPVIDLNEEHEVEGYVAGDVIKDYLMLRDRTCVFPNCNHTARACDADHIDPWQTDDHGRPIGGPTCTCNLAPLCRRHHLWKTHEHRPIPGRSPSRSGWTYLMLGPATYYWRGPYGVRFLRTHEGTIEVTDDAWHRRDLQARRDGPDLETIERLEHEQGDDTEPDIEAILSGPPRRPSDAPCLPGLAALNSSEHLPEGARPRRLQEPRDHAAAHRR